MADRICDNCFGRVPAGSGQCPKCGITFENTNPGGALPNGWVLAGRYTVGRYNDIDGEGVTYSAIDGNTLQRVVIKEFMPVTLCASRDETGSIRPKPGNEVLFKTTRIDFAELYGTLLRMGLTEGLVQVLDVVEENNTAYAVLEKIEGPTLAEYLTKREGAVDAARAVALMRPVLNGVEAMHAANMVHRGIAPENIILESGGTAKLCGYGTLALRQQGSELKPKLYPGYTAPEQYAANEFEGRYTDIYAMGAVLYRLVAGEAPYPANERRMQDNLRPARTVNRDVPAYLSAGIARAMRLVPAERIQNIPDLRLALAGEGGGGRTGKPEGRGPLGLTRQQLIVGACAVGAVVVLLLIILLISAFTRNRGKEDPSSSVSISVSSSISVGETIPDFTGKLYEDVAKNAAYTDIFNFDEPVMEYSNDVEAGRIIRQDPKGGDTWDGSTKIKLWVSDGMEPVVMPDFVNTFTTQEDAEKKLKELGIEYTVATEANAGKVEPGTVTKTDPAAGSEVKPGKDKVVLYVAGEVKTVAMPDITGRKEAEGIAELTRVGITQYRVNTIANSEGYHKVGLIYSTDPPAGGEVATEATIVNVNVLDKFYMPNLESYMGGDYTALTTYLDKIGVPYSPPEVTDNDISSDNDGKVASIDYVVNAEVTSSTKVVITYYGNYQEPAD
ncbi:PASTA domain-containing protein [Ruminococcaceae bacterium OttesenSCG-928-D13]|nr:PASTA domain-containing protein [Ruminococcaceae bacterium OttesenSCG-928-D13]